MSRRTAMRARRPLELRCAAWRTARSRDVGGSPPVAWLRVALRWRRRLRRSLLQRPAGRAREAQVALWQPRIDLHVALALHTRTTWATTSQVTAGSHRSARDDRRRECRGSWPAMARLAHHWPSAHPARATSAEVVASSRGTSRGGRTNPSTGRARMTAGARSAAGLLPLQTPRRAASGERARSAASRLRDHGGAHARAAFSGAPSTPQEETARTRTATLRLPAHGNELRLPLGRGASGSTSVVRAVRPRGDTMAERAAHGHMPRAAARPSEMVWRTQTRDATGPRREASTPDAVAVSTSVRASRSSVSPPAVVAGVESVNRSPEDAFDPRLLDRITDDVIRRVERRVRIERERRGL